GAASVVAFSQSTGWFRLGYDSNQAWGLMRSIRFRTSGGSLLMDPSDGGFVLGVETLPLNQDIRAAMACSTESGNLAYLYDDGSGWKLAWPGGGTGTTDVFFAIAVDNANATVTVSSVRWANLSGPWADDYGIATDRIAGSVGHWQPFAHEPDCLVEWTMAMVGGGDGYGDVYLRFTDE